MTSGNESAKNAQGFVKGDTSFMRRPFEKLPLNLSEWVAPKTLAGWVKEAVQNFDRSKPQAREFLLYSAESRPESLLRVVLYAYATQVYGSEEIAGACRTELMLKELCDGKVPFADELEHFRRKNRSLLEHLLGEILVRAVKEKFVRVDHLPPGFQHSLFRRAVDAMDTARHMNREE
jgi:hypothetical protein